MPKENKKRGRRGGEDKKRKHEDAGDDVEAQHKRHKSSDPEETQQLQHDNAALPSQEQVFHGNGNGDDVSGAYPDKPFFGMLDDDEQEYFKHADEMLEVNAFGDAEERKLFLASVYREADGKELKIANSQSCSRLMERLIQLSTPAQLKTLFQKFSGK